VALTFYASHGNSIERIAIVGHDRWRDHALMFAAVDLRSAPVQFFSQHLLAEARDWLFADHAGERDPRMRARRGKDSVS
jgi:hypothetical protein